MFVEVAYALPEKQVILSVTVDEDCTVQKAIEISGILEHFSGIDLFTHKVGIFGKTVGLDTPLQRGDRVEIYRPLLVDPKEARRRRAKKTP